MDQNQALRCSWLRLSVSFRMEDVDSGVEKTTHSLYRVEEASVGVPGCVSHSPAPVRITELERPDR